MQGVQRSAQACMSQRHITNAKWGWESPRIKRIQAPETGDGALLLSSPTGANEAKQVSQCTIHAQRRTRLVFFFFSPLSLSFSKEGCTRACMGQLEHRPCALCHYNSRASEELVWLRRRGERSPAADTTLLRRKGTKHLPAWQCSHRNLQSLATVVLAIMNAKCHSLTPEE